MRGARSDGLGVSNEGGGGEGHGRLWLDFADGCSGEVEIPMQAGDPLAEVFDQARCNGLTVEWPGGIDYCPDTLRAWCEAAKEAACA